MKPNFNPHTKRVQNLHAGAKSVITRSGVGMNEEKKLWKRGFLRVVGLDEAGRGPLAGPVVAAAVTVNFKFEILHLKSNQNFKKINDSKRLTEKQREELYEMLTNHSAIEWGVGIVSEKVIDKVNILEATKLSMCKAIDNLNSKLQDTNHKQITNPKKQNSKRVDFILIDGNFGLQAKIAEKSIIKGDSKVFSIAAASIIAKVTRDRIMRQMHSKYPEYGFLQHKGYGTAIHLAALQKHGASKIHRKTFYPVSGIAKT